MSEWKSIALGEVFKRITASIEPSSYPEDIFDCYSLPAFDQCGGAETMFGEQIASGKTLLKKRALLISKLNPRKPRVMVAEPTSSRKACASTEFVALEPYSGKVDEYFFKYLFLASEHASRLTSLAVGSTNSHARCAPRDLLRLTVPVPPLPEQRKIAAILSSVDRAIESTEKLIAKLKDLKTAMMQELLTKGLPPDVAAKHGIQKSGRFKDSPVGRVPEEWEVVRLGDMAKVQTGIAKNSAGTGNKSLRLPYLRVANVQDGYVDLSEVKRIDVPEDRVGRYLLRRGDVLFNEGGDYDKLGRGCVWRCQIEPAVHQNHVFVVRCGRKVMPVFLASYSASTMGKRFFIGASKQTTNLASINSSQLRQFQLPVPPMAEQTRIVLVLQSIEQTMESRGTKLAGLLSLKTALMQDLLTGRIRVTT